MADKQRVEDELDGMKNVVRKVVLEALELPENEREELKQKLRERVMDK